MADPALIQALENYGFTSFSNLLKPLAMPRGTLFLPPVYRNISAGITLFVPPNDVVDSIVGISALFSLVPRRLAAYQAASGLWTFDPASPAHVVIKTGFSAYQDQISFYISLENNTAQSVVAVPTLDPAGDRKIGFVNQSATIIEQKPDDPNHPWRIYAVDKAFDAPTFYDTYATTNADVGLFHQLMEDAFAFNLSLIQGFTAFVPTGNPNWTQMAHKRYSDEPLHLASFFNNHVIPFHTIYSSQFPDNSFTSASQSACQFDYDASTGQWSVELNGVKASITTADIPLADGVVHFIDQPFWNLNNSATASSTSATTPTAQTTNSQTNPSEAVSDSSQLSPGIIAAIVVPIVAAIILTCVGGYLYWRYRRMVGVRELVRRREGIDGSHASVTPAALRTSPFMSSVDDTGSVAANPSIVGSSSGPGASSSEKRSGGQTEYTIANVTSAGGSHATTSTAMPHMSEETAQRLLQMLSQRRDTGTPNLDLPGENEGERPPEYRA